MNAFYLRTDGSSAGPFTGVELREAALSGIIDANSRVGGQPGGPWITASNAGLFNEKMVPLPHPPGVHVPRYQVQGMPGAFQGPFKLRELIGFAARGMLPTDARLQSDLAPDWISVERIPILTATLSGQLVLVAADGTLHRRAVVAERPSKGGSRVKPGAKKSPARAGVVPVGANSGPADTPSADSVAEAADGRSPESAAVLAADSVGAAVFAPQAITHSVDASDATTRSRGRWTHDEPAAKRSVASADDDRQSATDELTDDSPGPLRSLGRRLRSWNATRRLARAESNAPSRGGRRLASVTVALLLVVGAGVASSRWQGTPMPRTAIVGDWVTINSTDAAEPGSDAPELGIAFRPDGTCVLFDPNGDSWTGDYEWIERAPATTMTSMNVSSTITKIDPAHQEGDVLPTDGYLRLSAVGGSQARLGNAEVADLFVRRANQQLMVGYPASVEWSAGTRTMRAGWISLSPAAMPQIERRPADPSSEPRGLASRSVVAALAELQSEPSRDADVSPAAVDIAAAAGQLVKRDEAESGAAESRVIEAYSSVVDGGYLLSHFGVPDEARPLFGFERERFNDRISRDGAQLVRYDSLRFVFSRQGQVRGVFLN